jgi:hypothetical protein
MNDQNTADELTINERPYIPFSLPHSVKADLTTTAEYLRWPVSDLLEAFIETRWQSFATGKLPAVWHWRSFPTDSLTPEWLSLWRQRYGNERGHVVMLALSGAIRQRIEPILREEERRFYVSSLSDTLRLFFASEWETFKQSVSEQERREQ